MFGNGPKSKKRGSSTESTKTKGQDIVLNLEVDFMDAVLGCEKDVSFNRTDVCITCKGTKAKPGTSPSKCGGCGGAGYQSIK
jgi:molecular chaperone DnaJ